MKNNQYNTVSMPGLSTVQHSFRITEYPIWVKVSICSHIVQMTCIILEDMVAKIVYLGIPKQN